MKIKKICNNLLTIFLVFGILLSTIGLPPFLNVKAEDNNTKLEVQSSSNTITIDSDDTNMLVYTLNSVNVGTVKVKIGSDYIAPTMSDGRANFVLTKYVDTAYNVTVEVTSSEGYNNGSSFHYNGAQTSFPENGIVSLNVASNNVQSFDFSFVADGTGGDVPAPTVYPVVGYFDGVANGVTMNDNGSILVPSNWSTGNISFKAKTCTVNGTLIGYDATTCGTIPEVDVDLKIEGIANSSQINNSVTSVSQTRDNITVTSDFSNYGHAIVHLISENQAINMIVSVDLESLITLTAEAPLEMSFSVGSTSVKQAIVTSDVTKDVSVFFGNTKATLVAAGPHVNKITAVTGASASISNGSATITLPDLSVETTTKVTVSILMDDGNTVTRSVNIVRTAVMLEYNKQTNTVNAGYVMNKAYLYNNEDHSDAIFDAYLQVILYKDNTVVGYKQIKIDDEDIINGLSNDGAASIETFDNNHIVVYDGKIQGVNGVSVFLTNGPIKGSSDTLPSIEYGIGAGVKLTWEAE